MNIYYMSKLNKNREWRKKWERRRLVGSVCVCGCSLGEPLRQQQTSHTSSYISTRA